MKHSQLAFNVSLIAETSFLLTFCSASGASIGAFEILVVEKVRPLEDQFLGPAASEPNTGRSSPGTTPVFEIHGMQIVTKPVSLESLGRRVKEIIVGAETNP
jgi:hypothetical protein